MATPASRSLTCAQCGAAFTCSGDATCWCAAEPYRLPMPDGEAAGDCLCPACLRDKASRSARQTAADCHRSVT
jgi:hypothetical protein